MNYNIVFEPFRYKINMLILRQILINHNTKKKRFCMGNPFDYFAISNNLLELFLHIQLFQLSGGNP